MVETMAQRDGAVLADRRRPGRPDTVAAALLPLLRAEERAKLPPLDDALPAPPRGLDTGPGVLLGAIIGSLMWAALGAGLAALF